MGRNRDAGWWSARFRFSPLPLGTGRQPVSALYSSRSFHAGLGDYRLLEPTKPGFSAAGALGRGHIFLRQLSKLDGQRPVGAPADSRRWHTGLATAGDNARGVDSKSDTASCRRTVGIWRSVDLAC